MRQAPPSHVFGTVVLLLLLHRLRFSASVTCPPECICLSQSQVLCNTGGLTEIPLSLLPPTVEHLSLTKNHFPVIRSDAFAGLRLLRKLSLDGNNVTTIKPFAFRGLPRLRELSIQHTPLATVAQFAFAGLQNITAILLGHNKIRKVEGYAFAGTSNVRLLLLNNNPIQKVETAAFSGLTNVEHLLLPSGIRILEPDAFSGLDSVGLIKLPFMDLRSLGAHTFRGLSHVHVLAIQESDLGTVEPDAFDGLAHIGSLNVYNNKIDSIREFRVRPANKVKIIRFHGNHLLESPRAGAIVIQGVDTLSVTANHFPCDCRIHSLLEGPFGNSTAGDFRTKNFCISPLDVNGKAIAELDVEAIARCREEAAGGNWDAPSSASVHGLVAASACLTALLVAGWRCS